jgi:hypothetical protein
VMTGTLSSIGQSIYYSGSQDLFIQHNRPRAYAKEVAEQNARISHRPRAGYGAKAGTNGNSDTILRLISLILYIIEKETTQINRIVVALALTRSRCYYG